MKIKRGSTSVRRLIFVADTSKTDGSGLANLAYNTSGLVAYYFAGDLNNEVQITLATATLGTWTSGGFIAVDNTNMPGWYEIGIPDAALDGGNEVAIQLRGAANMAPVNVYIELDTVDYQTAAFGAALASDWTATKAGYVDAPISSRSSHTANNVRDAVWNAMPSAGYTNESFGDRILISDNDQRTIKVTGGGSGHIAADIHAAQAGVLTETVFGDAAMSARVVAADAVTEIQGTMPDRLGYTLAILAGACSDAGTAGETYAITLDTVTYTVDYTGLTSVGNRGTTSLSKSP